MAHRHARRRIEELEEALYPRTEALTVFEHGEQVLRLHKGQGFCHEDVIASILWRAQNGSEQTC